MPEAGNALKPKPEMLSFTKQMLMQIIDWFRRQLEK